MPYSSADASNGEAAIVDGPVVNRASIALGEALGRLEQGEKLSVPEAVELGAAVSEMMVYLTRWTQKAIDAEFREITQAIGAMKAEVGSLLPSDLSTTHLPIAERELGAVVTASEDAANAIMGAAETIIGADSDDPSYKELVDEQVTQIFEACTFQDITGQRIAKVMDTLRRIEARLERLGMPASDQPSAHQQASPAEADRWPSPSPAGEEGLLNGPAMPGEGIAQDEVDALFAD